MVDLEWRQFQDQYTDVATAELWRSPVQYNADLTIAIPTYNRSGLLPDALRSAREQKTVRPTRIIILDNCSEHDHTDRTLAYLRDLVPDNVTLYRNARNIGMFGNWNRCLTVAGSKWINILNDDDILLEDFVETAMSAVEQVGGDAVVARTRPSNMKGEELETLPLKTRVLAKIRNNPLVSWVRGTVTQVTIRDMFWGVPLGNSLCFIGNRTEMLRAGGYRESDYPAADYLFYVRWATQKPIYRVEKIAGLVRYGENESMKASTIDGFIVQGRNFRRALLDKGYGPSWWAKYINKFVSKDIGVYRALFDHEMPADHIRSLLNDPDYADSTTFLELSRLWHLGPRKAL